MKALEFAWLAIIFPFIGVLAVPMLARIHAKISNAAAVFFPFLAALSSLMLLPVLFHPEALPAESSFVWFRFPFIIECGVLVDPLSIVLAVVVALISFIITVYCLGYMKGDPGIVRFWMMVNLFIGSMLLLVFANNLLFLFIGWKLVGLCSYGLIGYYYQDDKKYWIGGPAPTPFITPSHAGLKALVMTSAGDLIMLGGILIIFYYAGTFNLMDLYRSCAVWLPKMSESPGLIILVSCLLIAGPIGKSAQFPLHEWLPEAMAGPGPVSALIHAATMVKSGVYLVARLIPIFYYGYWVAGFGEASVFFHLIAWVGGITAFIAATQGLVALELKKALAFSTVSQIGYMWIGLGVAGLTETVLVSGITSGIFHLVSHAVFKACLFLCAGSVIHAAHSIYMSDMGGMRKYMPYTWICMLIAALCLMGLPPLAGFWSKDAVLLASLEAHNIPIFVLAMITVVLTAFYTTRFVGMVFYGRRSENLRRLSENGRSPHESDRTMWGACAVLAVFIILLGMMGPKVEHLLQRVFQTNMSETLQVPVLRLMEPSTHAHWIVSVLSITAILAGAIPAYYIYIVRQQPISIDKSLIAKNLYAFFWQRWWIDPIYYRIFVDGTLKLSDQVANQLENRYDTFIHRIFPEFITKKIHGLIIRVRTESDDLTYAGTYAVIILIGILAIALL